MTVNTTGSSSPPSTFSTIYRGFVQILGYSEEIDPLKKAEKEFMDKINLQVIRESFGRVVYSHKTYEKDAEKMRVDVRRPRRSFSRRERREDFIEKK